ncbi:uncharacterized protein BN778_01332 [Mycoplasma sp. CAG:776]|nr:uncharacterized protein BN778_01332 [Mycoplasma sp. CAG:776]
MNLDELKITGNNKIHLTDSLETSLLSFKLTLTESTIIPDNNKLIIYVSKEENETNNRKTYEFNLKEKLGLNDEFILEPVIKNNKIELKGEVKRNSGNIEEIEYQNIDLFEGENYIYTNYENATIDVIYPKNIELVKYYLNNVLYSLNNKNKILSLDDIYFKDAFTKTDDLIDANLNNLNINCLTSNNNKFHLDSEGNLTVNSLTTSISSSNTNFDEIYPIGSIYMSVNNTNPSTLFGGTWEQITGYYLYAGNTNETGGSNITGAASGETGATALTVNQIPSHTHYIPSLSGSTTSNGDHIHNIGADFDGGAASARYTVHSKGPTGAGYLKPTSQAGAHTHSITTNANNTGASGNNASHTHSLNNHTHTINPPFYSLFVFKRIA